MLSFQYSLIALFAFKIYKVIDNFSKFLLTIKTIN